MGPPLRKPLFRRNFVMNTALHIYTLKTTVFKQKKRPKKITVTKWPPNDRYSFRARCFDFGKNLKNTFPMKCFNEIWLIIGDHEYIKIPEIKIGNFYSGGILGEKHFFLHPKNTNLYWLARQRRADLNFCVKRRASMRVTITNNTGQKFDAILVKYAKNCGRAPWDPLGT